MQIVQRPLAAEKIDGADHLSPLLEKIYLQRGVTSIDELNYDFGRLLPYHTLTGIEVAVDCLYSVLVAQKRVLVVGDFDADGATSTVLVIKALKLMGFKYVDYLVPNRFMHGYGLTPELVAMAVDFKPNLIITVDNGISNHAGVKAAKELGIQVIITDHHLPHLDLPVADAIVNPNQPGDQFPSKCLAGVGVIFYVMLALRKFLRDRNWFVSQGIPEPNLAQFLDLVALGTVADVVPLDKNNRLLVYQGLQRIRSGKIRAGLQALLDVAQCRLLMITGEELGYLVAPRLNAAGRLDDMAIGIECLLQDDYDKAYDLAAQLNLLNKERRALETTMHREAETVLADLVKNDDLPLGICLLKDSWHQGILGIIATRLKDLLHRPVIAFAKVNDHEIKGSARSIAGIHIRDILSKIVQKNPTLLTKFGGHAMAAGLSLGPYNYAPFCEAFLQELALHDGSQNQVKHLYIDGELTAEDLSLQTAELLRSGGPWGHEFNAPRFGGRFKLMQRNLFAEKHLKMTLNLVNTTAMYNAVAFNAQKDWHKIDDDLELYVVYSLGVNVYRGAKNLQLMVEHLEPV